MDTLRKNINRLYRLLLGAYGPQGWWPLSQAAGAGTAGLDEQGYHPAQYGLPDNAAGRFEVAVGAVLTQNTAWRNVVQALGNLRRDRLLSPRAVHTASPAVLRRAVRSSGYYNQKAKKLKYLANFFLKDGCLRTGRVPHRAALLSIWGVGEETADSILLYAFHEPVFVIDAYTRRLLARLGWAEEKTSYRQVQEMMQRSLPPDRVKYNEYHALIVEHAKRHCRKKPVCDGCPVALMCPWPASLAERAGETPS
jgi:endonuclease-3 related protein